jgi:hypothetical protein
MRNHYSTMVLTQFALDQRSLFTLFHHENPERDHQLVQFVDSVDGLVY